MKLLHVLLAILLIISLGSCETTEKAEACADTFFQEVIAGKHESASNYLADKPLEKFNKIEVVKLLSINPEQGKLLSASKNTGFSTNIQNGVSTVQMPYELTYENGTITYSVVVVDRGNGMKIEYLN
ncbi:MAG: hypothetical protein AB8B53_13075 [Flavobacteriales bacterium]